MSAPGSGATNRLARESSPYLLLHAGNPVDWYPWGEEAFVRARNEDKPIFLSIGYSTCYWCHVMERESFSDPGIARQLNQGFVSIKLDREERPDVDEIYMTATQLLTRSGGWPNSVFLTPDLAPFFAGTYFPPSDRYGRPGFPRVLAAVREAWTGRRESVLEQAATVSQAIRDQIASGAPGEVPGSEAVAVVRTLLARRFDPDWGGFGPAPKFPSPSNLFFLLERAREGDDEARRMLVTTLDAMAQGGIHDQLAGGFHRYSTDARWLVPHFEKMLYDNAALAALYAEADALAPESGFARVARATLDFVLAEMTGDHGGFLSAIDAETDGHEGAYYTWTREELSGALGADDHALLAATYGFDGGPNFEHDRYVLHLPQPLAERARLSGLGGDELLARLEPGRRALLAVRGRRPRPLTDDKVLADWNGLMIGAMARAGSLLGEARYVDAACQAAAFVLSHHVAPATGELLHAWRRGVAKVPALLDDYAFLVEGLLRLHAASRDERWLLEAARLAEEQDRRLWDAGSRGYFASGEDPWLLFRPKAAHDGAVASGNGVAALNLLDLARRTGRAAYRERAGHVVSVFARGIAEWPLAHVTLVRAAAGLEPTAGRAAASAPGPLEAEALGVVEARAEWRGAGEGGWRPFAVELRIREGWHVNANPASLASLVPTAIDSDAPMRNVRYPDGKGLPVAFARDALQCYDGLVRIEGEVDAASGTRPLRLTYQACDDARCLPPVTRDLLLG